MHLRFAHTRVADDKYVDVTPLSHRLSAALGTALCAAEEAEGEPHLHATQSEAIIRGRGRAPPACNAIRGHHQRPSSEATDSHRAIIRGHHQRPSSEATDSHRAIISGNHLDHLVPKYGRAEGGGEQLEQVPLVIRMQLRDLAQISRRERERSVRGACGDERDVAL